jgi:multidrug efflux pump subunit AcrB
LKYAIAFDTTYVVSASIRDVLMTLMQAIGLVLPLICLFLREWRSTVMSAA